jgi:cephalosporin-C deacetylase-like acetyl esterase
MSPICFAVRAGVLGLFLAAGLVRGEDSVTVARKDDRSVVATGRTYTARIDPAGNLVSLTVGGVELMDTKPPNRGGAFPATEGATSVEVQGAVVTAVREGIRVEYAFDAAGFQVTTVGGTVEPRVQGVTAAICEGGVTTDGREAVADVRKLVLGRAAVGLGKPFHLMQGRLVPSHLCGRGGKPEDRFAYRVECGIVVDPLELVTTPALVADGRDADRVPEFRKGETPAFAWSAGNLGADAVSGEVRFVLKDHRVEGRTLAEKVVPVSVPPGKPGVARFAADAVKEPGICWLEAEFRKDGKPVRQTRLGFLNDSPAYRPPLTRPADFRAFWEKKLRDLRAIPFDAKLAEAPAKATPATRHFNLDIVVEGGRRIRTFLRVPKAPGRYDAEIISHWGSNSEEQVLKHLADLEGQKPGVGLWERGVPRIRVGAPQPDDSTYTRWNGADDNNLLDSCLRAVRMTDYLRSRDDVKGILLFGASRSGALQLANAALDPAKVVAVNVHVPTSAGLSWKEKPYRGWGSLPGNLPPDAARAVAAYFDPANFAPDLAVPLLIDGGIDDDLSPVPGILALANHAAKSPWVRCAIEKGGHGYFSKPARAGQEQEMAGFLHYKNGLPE